MNGRLPIGAFAFSLALVTGCATAPRASSELQLLQGTWEGAQVGENDGRKIRIAINSNSLDFHRDTNFWFKTTFTVPAGKNPPELHATIKDCPPPKDSIGKLVIAIFKIEEGTLTLAAFGDGDEDATRSFEAGGLARYVLTKIPTSPK